MRNSAEIIRIESPSRACKEIARASVGIMAIHKLTVNDKKTDDKKRESLPEFFGKKNKDSRFGSGPGFGSDMTYSLHFFLSPNAEKYLFSSFRDIFQQLGKKTRSM